MKPTLFLTACLAGAILPIAVLADFGPSEWPQYRLDSSNNAVFDNGSEPLTRRKFKTTDQVRATPVVVGNSLFIGNHSTGGLFRFDLASGEPVWDDDNPWFRHAPNWVHSDMIQANGMSFVGYGNRVFQSPEVRGSGQSGVMALNPEDGETLWMHETVGEVMPTPAFWEDTLYVATGGGELIALESDSGKRLWALDLPGWVSMSSPAVKDGVLYVGSLDSLVAVDLEARKTRWIYEAKSSFTDVPPAIADENVVIITGMTLRSSLSEEDRIEYQGRRGGFHFIYGIDAKTGELLWRDLLGTGAHQDTNTSGSPAIADGRVYVGSPYTRSVMAYDVQTGERLWEYPVGAPVKGAPVIADGKVYFGDGAGFLHMLIAEDGTTPRCEDGQPAGKMKLGGSSNASPAVALAPAGPVIINKTLFVGSQDGFVYAVPTRDLNCKPVKNDS